MRDLLRSIRRRFGFKICALGLYAVVADIMLCVVVLPFQRYALLMAHSDESTPALILSLLLCDLLMLAYVLSGMAANGAVIRFGLKCVPLRKNLRS